MAPSIVWIRDANNERTFPDIPDPIQYQLNVTTEPQIKPFATGCTAANGTEVKWRNCTVQETANGRYTVTFATAHPDGDAYEVVTGVSEDGTLRDVPKISLVEGSRTANSFQVQITLDDNGGAADTYSSHEWSFSVYYEADTITAIALEEV